MPCTVRETVRAGYKWRACATAAALRFEYEDQFCVERLSKVGFCVFLYVMIFVSPVRGGMFYIPVWNRH
jgi:hypothetical protein